MEDTEQLKQRIDLLEQELAQNREQYIQALRELLPPLTPIKGFVRTLLDDTKGEWYTQEDRLEFYRIIDENVDLLKRRIGTLINGK